MTTAYVHSYHYKRYGINSNVSYEINGKEYEASLSIKYKKNEIIDIYYDTNNYINITSDKDIIYSHIYLLLLFATNVFLILILFFIKKEIYYKIEKN